MVSNRNDRGGVQLYSRIDGGDRHSHSTIHQRVVNVLFPRYRVPNNCLTAPERLKGEGSVAIAYAESNNAFIKEKRIIALRLNANLKITAAF